MATIHFVSFVLVNMKMFFLMIINWIYIIIGTAIILLVKETFVKGTLPQVYNVLHTFKTHTYKCLTIVLLQPNIRTSRKGGEIGRKYLNSLKFLLLSCWKYTKIKTAKEYFRKTQDNRHSVYMANII